MCAIIARFIRDLLYSAGLAVISPISNEFIGYIGTDLIGSLIKRFAAKSRSVKMVETNNQRGKAFLGYAGWSEGTG